MSTTTDYVKSAAAKGGTFDIPPSLYPAGWLYEWSRQRRIRAERDPSVPKNKLCPLTLDYCYVRETQRQEAIASLFASWDAEEREQAKQTLAQSIAEPVQLGWETAPKGRKRQTAKPRTPRTFAPDVVTIAEAARIAGVSSTVMLRRIMRGDVVARKLEGSNVWIVSRESAATSKSRPNGRPRKECA